MHVSVFNRQRILSLIPEKVAALVKEVVTFEKCPCAEVAVHFIGAAAMRRLHGLYFHDSSLTDCLSFPIDDDTAEDRILGDVFVCPLVARAYVRQHGGDLNRETTLYVVHGLLHLMGYDDIKENCRKKMRAAEERHMRHLVKRGFL